MQDQSSTVSNCPSFSSYSRDHNLSQLSKIAARVGEEEEVVHDSSRDQNDEFEFAFPRADPDASDPVAEVSPPVFPLFDRALLLDEPGAGAAPTSPIRLVSLGTLFMAEERGEEGPPSSSESEADEMDGIPPGSYCVWKPNSSPSPGRCKKSNSTGSSACSPSSFSNPMWRIRDLLPRSSSDGTQSYMFLAPPSRNNKEVNPKKLKEGKTASSNKGKPSKEKASAHEVFYARSKALREGDKRRSYLPYKQDLVGFFSAVNGLGRTLPPF